MSRGKSKREGGKGGGERGKSREGETDISSWNGKKSP